MLDATEEAEIDANHIARTTGGRKSRKPNPLLTDADRRSA